ncbi:MULTISPECIES: PucR family transcriptional regulator ligand-binding domain-containing protein [unclassified Streptomyces]|uniref:PucR family transcriptional regulator n=1 Tax=unclassified Streptomyces TaxID=2593676 RepID=UPI00343F00A6
MNHTAHLLTVAAVAGLEGLHLAVEHAGSRMDAVIAAPHAAELPLPGTWLQGGEIVMTSGALLGTEPEAWAGYIGELAQLGAAGLILGIGPRAPLREVPGFLVDLAREHDLPLLSAPATTTFPHITKSIIARQVEAERVTVQDSFALQVRLTRIVARGGTVDALLQEWQRSTGEHAGVFDRVGRLLGKNPGLPAAAAEAIATRVRANPPALGRCESVVVDGAPATMAVSPFAGETTVRGYLARCDGGLSMADLAVPTLLSLLALEFERRWFLDEPERRRRAQRLARLLTLDDDTRARAFLRGLGISASTLWGVVVEATSQTHAEVLLDDLAVVLGTPLLRVHEGLVEGLATQDPERLLQEYGVDAPVGVGTAVSPAGAARTLRQARAALETSKRIGSLVGFVDGAAHEFLLRVADNEYLTAFADAVLAPIDATANGDVLLETLHTWLAENRSVEACALRLGVHRHTIRNRVHRLTQITGRSLDNVDAQTEFWLALKARGFRD